MSDIAISVENLSKQYHIGSLKRSETFAEAALHTMTGPVRRTLKLLRGQYSGAAELDDTFWALKDISFQVGEGEVVGIIGRNGAGKSTLLKLLSRITYPTIGRIKIYGRVGSLLEVGTGFHPELTGRENVYLNGAILGMNKAEIARKFDAIIAFSGVERFIDTPVKHYSSGMSVRLAFAVAAHLEPDILLIDEVLAVGDAEFQQKCLGRMGDIAEGGRTILFVSHNMAAIQHLCQRCILLENGHITFAGATNEVIAIYLSNLHQAAITIFEDRRQQPPEAEAWYTGVEFRLSNGERTEAAISGQDLDIVLTYRAQSPGKPLNFFVGIYNSIGEKILHLGTPYTGNMPSSLPTEGTLVCHLPRLPLPEGRYYLNLSLHSGTQRVDLIPNVAFLNVQAGDFFGTGKVPPARENKVLIDYSWQVQTESVASVATSDYIK